MTRTFIADAFMQFDTRDSRHTFRQWTAQFMMIPSRPKIRLNNLEAIRFQMSPPCESVWDHLLFAFSYDWHRNRLVALSRARIETLTRQLTVFISNTLPSVHSHSSHTQTHTPTRTHPFMHSFRSSLITKSMFIQFFPLVVVAVGLLLIETIWFESHLNWTELTWISRYGPWNLCAWIRFRFHIEL